MYLVVDFAASNLREWKETGCSFSSSPCCDRMLPRAKFDKELLAIVDSFAQWRHFLEGSSHQITVFSDHKNLAYFQNARVLNRWQAQWARFLTRFDIKITYRPRKQQGKADALSQHSYLALHPDDRTFDNKKQVILGPTQLQETWICDTPLDPILSRPYVKTWR